jgi:hypothetical protein
MLANVPILLARKPETAVWLLNVGCQEGLVGFVALGAKLRQSTRVRRAGTRQNARNFDASHQTGETVPVPAGGFLRRVTDRIRRNRKQYHASPIKPILHLLLGQDAERRNESSHSCCRACGDGWHRAYGRCTVIDRADAIPLGARDRAQAAIADSKRRGEAAESYIRSRISRSTGQGISVGSMGTLGQLLRAHDPLRRELINTQP